MKHSVHIMFLSCYLSERVYLAKLLLGSMYFMDKFKIFSDSLELKFHFLVVDYGTVFFETIRDISILSKYKNPMM